MHAAMLTAVRALPIIGSLDQVTDSTPVLETPARARRAIAALFATPLEDAELGACER
jgi:hypothetical protein